ncbi:hypothetical protein ACFCWD_19040 [Streptomyces sp. NPDC056374]|uniref:hypothetical protein n=1 Tax=unclassified Streptomyces TaxID=2593676 RepID=UPI0035DD02A3
MVFTCPFRAPAHGTAARAGVLTTQPLLAARGYRLAADGAFGKKTANTQRKDKPRGSDPRWHGTLTGIAAEYVHETPRNGGVHWDITFK